MRSVYHLEKIDLIVLFLGRERRLWRWLCWHQPGLLYECTIWSYLQVDYNCWGGICMANTRTDTSGTSNDSDKLCNIFIQVHIQGNEWCGRPPPLTHTHVHPHMHIHTCTHTCPYTPTHVHEHLCWWDIRGNDDSLSRYVVICTFLMLIGDCTLP